MSDQPLCLYEVNEHIATITLNRPHRLNAFNAQSYRETTEAFVRADADPEVRCIILTGAGRGFCSGDDVEELMGGDGLEGLSDADAPRFEIPSVVMARTDRPVIAAVNGASVGYGFEVALLADVRIGQCKVLTDVHQAWADRRGGELHDPQSIARSCRSRGAAVDR